METLLIRQERIQVDGFPLAGKLIEWKQVYRPASASKCDNFPLAGKLIEWKQVDTQVR